MYAKLRRQVEPARGRSVAAEEIDDLGHRVFDDVVLDVL
jgi:hypothetical protein